MQTIDLEGCQGGIQVRHASGHLIGLSSYHTAGALEKGGPDDPLIIEQATDGNDIIQGQRFKTGVLEFGHAIDTHLLPQHRHHFGDGIDAADIGHRTMETFVVDHPLGHQVGFIGGPPALGRYHHADLQMVPDSLIAGTHQFVIHDHIGLGGIELGAVDDNAAIRGDGALADDPAAVDTTPRGQRATTTTTAGQRQHGC